jgi:L-ascorbate metabolism protein UlaG (beta-lactamase superfamily)
VNASHWNNGRFYNPNASAPLRSFWDLLHWLCHRQPGPWPEWIPSSPGPKPPERVREGELRVTFIGHATVLVQMDGKNFLTDPIWSHRASPFSWIGPKRHRAPGLRFEDIPPIDAILLSHDHYDHMDTPTLLRLRAAHRPRILCSLGIGRRLQKLGFDAPDELDWWQSLEFAPALRIHCTPAQHFSGRAPWDRNRTLWCSWLIESRHGNVYFGGDTGLGPHFAEIARRYPPPRFALLPIGAFRPEWLMGPVHMSPDHALHAHRILGARASAGIHYGTFRLADDGRAEAVDRLRALVAQSPMPEDFWILKEGIGRDVFPNEQRHCAQEMMAWLPRRAGDEMR